MEQREEGHKMSDPLCDNPLNLVLEDPYYPKGEMAPVPRECSRGIIINDKGEIALHHVHRNDKYGDSIYYELPGGGAENEETPFEALQREIDEEMGYSIKEICYLGEVLDAYNLSKRYNHHSFFLARISGETRKHFVSAGDFLIKETPFFDRHEALELLRNQHEGGFEGLVKQRELPFLELAVEILDKHPEIIGL